MADDPSMKMLQKALEKACPDAKFGRASDLEDFKPNRTGSLKLDINLSIPFHSHSMHEIFGNPGSGKTTLALSILSEAVKAGKKVAFQDQERKLNKSLIQTFPNLVDELKVMYASTGEDALKMVDAFLAHFPGSVVVVDSVDALIPKETTGKDIGEMGVGNLARLMSQGCRKLNSTLVESGGTLIFLNQMRSTITMYGDPNTTSGGRALGFYTSQRVRLMDVTKGVRIDDDSGNVIGHKVRFSIVKNKVAPPFVDGEFPLLYGKGVDKFTELVEIARAIDVLPTEGKYIIVDDKKRFPSVVASMMEADPDFYERVNQAVLNEYWPGE